MLPGMSSAVNTPTTPGISRAADVSMEAIVPWATVERTNTAHRAPSTRMSVT